MPSLIKDKKAKCCGCVIKAGSVIKEIKRIGPRTVMISFADNTVHKFKMRDNSDAISRP